MHFFRARIWAFYIKEWGKQFALNSSGLKDSVIVAGTSGFFAALNLKVTGCVEVA